MGLTAEQLEERRAYLGGTDASALAGVNPPGWAQPISVYLEKVGLAPDRPSSRMMGMGTLLEPVVAGLFTEATTIKLRRWGRPVRSRFYPWMGGHLDRIAEDGGVFEAKWSMSKDGWGESLPNATPDEPVIVSPDWKAVVPLHYAVQVQHYLAVTGRPHAYLAALLGYGDFRWYLLHRDEELIDRLIRLESDFWHQHVLAGVPPEPDGSEAYGRHLRRLYHADDGEEAVATPEQIAMAELVRQWRLSVKADQAHLAEVEQQLQLSMGTTANLVGPGFTISWRQTKPVTKVQWEELATELLRLDFVRQGLEWPPTKKAQAERIRFIAGQLELASTEPGSRPFKPQFDADEE